MPNNRNLQDASLIVSTAMPASTSAVATPGIDLMNSSHGDLVAPFDVVVNAPVLTTGQLPDTKTMTYTLETALSGDAAFGSPVTAQTLGVQTGAGGVGAAAAVFRVRLALATTRYLRVKVTPSASGTGDASAAKATLGLQF